LTVNGAATGSTGWNFSPPSVCGGSISWNSANNGISIYHNPGAPSFRSQRETHQSLNP